MSSCLSLALLILDASPETNCNRHNNTYSSENHHKPTVFVLFSFFLEIYATDQIEWNDNRKWDISIAYRLIAYSLIRINRSLLCHRHCLCQCPKFVCIGWISLRLSCSATWWYEDKENQHTISQWFAVSRVRVRFHFCIANKSVCLLKHIAGMFSRTSKLVAIIMVLRVN